MPRPRQFNEFDVVNAAISYFGANNFPNASMRNLALHADVSCGSLYNAFGDKRSLFRRALIQSVQRIFRPTMDSEQLQLSPFGKIERFFAEAVETCTHPARNDARLLLRAGFEAANLDNDCGTIISDAIEAIEKYLTECVSAAQIEGEIIRNQPASDLGRLLLATLLSMIVLIRLRPDRTRLEDVVRPTLHRLRPLEIG